MTLYEINEAMFSLIDPETGELKDYDAFAELQMEREQKLENAGLWIKDLKAEAEAIDNEIKSLQERKKANTNKIESLKKYLDFALQGESFKTPRLSVSHRKSTSVEVADEELFIAYAMENAPDFLKTKVEVSKTAIKEALNKGEEVRYCSIVEKDNIVIK